MAISNQWTRALMVMPLLVTMGCMTSGTDATGMSPDRTMSRSSVESMVSAWPETARKAAMMATEKYGAPTGVTPNMLVWQNSGPWKRTIVYREEIQHDFPMPHKDVWEQFVDYDVPAGMFDELAHYDGSVIAERTKGELSARCDKEAANFLAINLAHDIITGRRTVEQARQFFGETMKAMMQGQMSPYVQGFTFPMPRPNTGDSDRPVM